MGRLIDADKFKTALEKAISKNEDMDCLDFLRISSVIDAQPTAYDPDKVVEQLDRISDEMNGMILDADCPQYYDGYEDGVQRAIEIVKAGGTDGVE